MSSRRTLSPQDYKVGWICALSTELAASEAMLDEVHNPVAQDSIDHNSYTLGRICGHNVVMMCLPAGGTGTVSAARAATRMANSFRSLRFGLMVGIGGGVPSEEKDIRLGDVVVSSPNAKSGGVLQYDFGKTVQEGRFVQTGTLDKPPEVLRAALSRLQAKHMIQDPGFLQYLADMAANHAKMKAGFAHPGADKDILYDGLYNHPEGPGHGTCIGCDPARRVQRAPRGSTDPVIHLGLIASGNQVMRDGATRDRLRREMGMDCFEMEAAGLMDGFPCLVIRGICDYADSHKNKGWQPYAAATAAAYAKELLYTVSRDAVTEAPVAPGTTSDPVAPETTSEPRFCPETKSDSDTESNGELESDPETESDRDTGSHGKVKKEANLPQVCLVCEQRCESLPALYRHLRASGHGSQHNRLKREAVKGQAKRESSSATNCRECGKEFRDRAALFDHARGAKHDQLYIVSAAGKGDLEEVRRRLIGGADIDARDEQTSTALHRAAENGHMHVVRFLLDQGADRIAERYPGHTPLDEAVLRGDLALVKVFFERGTGTGTNKRTDPNSVAYAAQTGNVEVAKLLLSQGANIDATRKINIKGLMIPADATPLYCAVDAGHENLVQFLLDRGAHQGRTEHGWYPLCLAAERGSVAVVKLLLERGMDNEAEFVKVLGYAFESLRERTAHLGHLFLDRGLPVEGAENDGDPLRHAASIGSPTLIRLLFRRGAKLRDKRFPGDVMGGYKPNCASSSSDATTATELIDHFRSRGAI
ncbi:nucleoside phosphorylase domain-containing protein [Lasiosphaeris hirsuta]|uniref:Nucleoside phosphorylase domain-containing protein n=1 Tax=Lasiosphaeris hirsuta TaxID=260670 RepID=A0AA40DID2_9PEZI|nr:nucleoside phosphorylase domain-containing protein [Lasiosphaeris hirsuta]